MRLQSFLTVFLGLFSVLGDVTAVAPCHRVFTATSTPKNFTSPGYPGQYTNDLRCSWTVEAAAPSKRVVIEVIDSVIEWSDQCSHDHAAAYDGNSTDKGELQKWCAEERPNLISASKSITVALRTDDSNVYKGFLIRYYETDVTTCGGTLIATETPSNLTSPNYPDVYPTNATCVWKITAENENRRVTLLSSDFHLDNQTDCSYDNLTVRDGSGTNSLLGVFCGIRSIYLTSPGRDLFLVFKSDGSSNFQGFMIYYISVKNSIMDDNSLMATKNHAFLRSPGYPARQIIDANTSWTINAPEGKLIKLNAKDVDVFQGVRCTTYNVLAIRNGKRSFGNVIDTWCRTNSSSVTINSNLVTIISYGAGIRFMLEYFTASDTPTCGGQLMASYTDSRFESLGYRHNTHCTWTITADNSNDLISIRLITYDKKYALDCLFDSLTVLDGASSETLQKFCGSMRPTIVSPGNSVSIILRSDGTNTNKDFEIQYHQVSTATSDSCNSYLYANDEDSFLMSPGYPSLYPNNMDCTWQITTNNSTKKVQLSLLVSNIEESADCSKDYVNVFDGPILSSTRMGTFCHQPTAKYASTWSSILIQFHTDSSQAKTGFKIMYKQVNQGISSACNEETTELAAKYFGQYIESPNYPHNYPNNADCSWRITAEFKDNIIQLDVVSSDLECDGGCSSSYVEAFDGYNDSSASLGKWCCNSIQTFHSSGKYMFVKFHSDASTIHSGFKIQYTTEYKIDYYNSNVAPVVGGIVGSFAFITLIALFVVYLLKRNKCRTSSSIPSNARWQGNDACVVGVGNDGAKLNMLMSAAVAPPNGCQERFHPPPYQPNAGMCPAQAQPIEKQAQ